MVAATPVATVAVVDTDKAQTTRDLQLFKFVVEKSDAEIYLIRGDGHFAYANPAALESLGYTAEQFSRLTLEDVDPGRGNDFPTRIKHLKAMGRPVIETQHLTRDGRKIPKEIHAFFLTIDNEEFACAFALDITARKQLEAERLRLEEATRQAQKMEAIGRLAGGIAHDFNNLLTSIRGYAEILLSLPNAPGPILDDIGEIKKAADRAALLTERLLAFGRKQLLSPTLLDLNDLLDAETPVFRVHLGGNIQLDLHKATALAAISADPHQLKQVLAALLTNAREAMPTGGRLTLSTHCENLKAGSSLPPNCAAGDYVVLRVSDTGHGMDRDTQARLFEPFFTTKERGLGTGLSLPAVYGIAQQHGAGITVTSSPNEGTTFALYFPAQHAGTTAQVLPPAPAAVHSATILLVEDEPSVQHLTARVLRDAGYKVLTADHAEAALKLAAASPEPIDLLVTDVIMPGMNGRDLCEALLKRRPSMKALYMSGYTADILADQGIDAARMPFILKPFSLQDLKARVQALLS